MKVFKITMFKRRLRGYIYEKNNSQSMVTTYNIFLKQRNKFAYITVKKQLWWFATNCGKTNTCQNNFEIKEVQK